MHVLKKKSVLISKYKEELPNVCTSKPIVKMNWSWNVIQRSRYMDVYVDIIVVIKVLKSV